MNEPITTLVGNLSKEGPELRFTPSGVAVCKFRMAQTPRTKVGEEWKDGEPLWIGVTCWRELGEHVAETLEGGSRVIVTGRLGMRTYETREGEKRTVVELEADAIGPELRYATAKVTKVAKSGGTGGGGGDDWSQASKARPAAAKAAPAKAAPAQAATPPSDDW